MSMYSYEPPEDWDGNWDGDYDESRGTCGICENILRGAERGLCAKCKAERDTREAERQAEAERNATAFAAWYLGVEL